MAIVLLREQQCSGRNPTRTSLTKSTSREEYGRSVERGPCQVVPLALPAEIAVEPAPEIRLRLLVEIAALYLVLDDPGSSGLPVREAHPCHIVVQAEFIADLAPRVAATGSGWLNKELCKLF